jgi:hypothetical protein
MARRVHLPPHMPGPHEPGEGDRMSREKSAKGEAKRLAKLVEQAVDDGAKTVEEIHRSIASLPLDVLERIDLFEQTVKDVRKVQDASIGAIYDLIHKVNREVGKLAAEVLERSAERPPAERKTSPRKAQPRRGAGAHARA